jgi:hypothetical protein
VFGSSVHRTRTVAESHRVPVRYCSVRSFDCPKLTCAAAGLAACFCCLDLRGFNRMLKIFQASSVHNRRQRRLEIGNAIRGCADGAAIERGRGNTCESMDRLGFVALRCSMRAILARGASRPEPGTDRPRTFVRRNHGSWCDMRRSREAAGGCLFSRAVLTCERHHDDNHSASCCCCSLLHSVHQCVH